MGSPIINSSFNLPSTAPLPNQKNISPLKRQRPVKIGASGSPAPFRRELFPSKRAKVEVEKKITFVAIAPEAKSDKYIETLPAWMQEEAVALEKLAQGLTQTKLQNVRSKIIQIAKKREWSEQKQRAELGILTYYVVIDRPIPGEASLIKHRTNELVTELDALKEQHQSAALEKQKRRLIPSGTVCYLRRAFVRMIFPPDGSLNLGGCYAIKELLNGKISLHFSNEQRGQILIIVDKLIKEESFRLLFKDPFEIAKDWEEVVRIDNQLSPTEPMSFVYVRWALLNALFSITGQIDNEGNCYAVATNMTALHAIPEKLVIILTQVLKTGTFDFEGQAIPVMPILESRRHYGKDFEVTSKRERLAELTPFNVAQNSLSLEKEVKMETEPVLLNTLMEEHFGSDVAYAKEVFLSHKQSLLQQTTLALFQFISLNRAEVAGSIPGTTINTEREVLFQLFDEMVLLFWLRTYGKCSSGDFMTFKSKITAQMYRSLFLVDFTNSKTEVNGEKVIFDFYPQGIKFDGHPEHYNIFHQITRLFHLKEGKLVPIDTIDALKTSLAEIINQSLSPLDSPKIQEIHSDLRTWLSDPVCTDKIAETVWKYNSVYLGDRHALSQEIYKESNALLFAQKGGYVSPILQFENFKEDFDAPVNVVATSTQDFLVKISTAIDGFITRHPDWNEQSEPPIIISSRKWHVYTLKPLFFKEYKSNPNLIEESILTPGARIIRKRPSDEQKRRALSYTVGIPAAERLWNLISHRRYGTTRVREACKLQLDPNLHTLFDHSFDQVMQEVSLDQVKQCLTDVCNDQGFILKHQDYFSIVNSLNTNKAFFTPYEVAQHIHQAVIQLNDSAFLDRDKLEGSIRSRNQLPQVFKIANLNWVPEFGEKARFKFLILKYDFAQESLTLATRRKGIESSLSVETINKLIQAAIFFEKK